MGMFVPCGGRAGGRGETFSDRLVSASFIGMRPRGSQQCGGEDRLLASKKPCSRLFTVKHALSDQKKIRGTKNGPTEDCVPLGKPKGSSGNEIGHVLGPKNAWTARGG